MESTIPQETFTSLILSTVCAECQASKPIGQSVVSKSIAILLARVYLDLDSGIVSRRQAISGCVTSGFFSYLCLLISDCPHQLVERSAVLCCLVNTLFIAMHQFVVVRTDGWPSDQQLVAITDLLGNFLLIYI
jgi:hypothetical protein